VQYRIVEGSPQIDVKPLTSWMLVEAKNTQYNRLWIQGWYSCTIKGLFSTECLLV
jgi:hypothetical protein